MRFIIDHDYHIHSQLSSCSSDPEQTPQAILDYAVRRGFKQICITDHYWDAAVEGASNWYQPQNFDHIAEAKPLPQDDSCRFLFGCETDMDRFFKIGCPKERWDDFDFIIVPTTHLHMDGFTFLPEQNNVEDKRELFIKRFEAFLNAGLPYYKVGLAHITCSLLHRTGYKEVLAGIDDQTFARLFAGCADVGCGVELNIGLAELANNDGIETILRPYRIAKQQGCKFYLGSDAHHPNGLAQAMGRFNLMIDMLELEESDKFQLVKA